MAPPGPRTRGDDANPQRAGHECRPRLVLVHAGVPLRPAHQAVQDLAEHAVSAHTDDAAGGTQGSGPPHPPRTTSPLLRWPPSRHPGRSCARAPSAGTVPTHLSSLPTPAADLFRPSVSASQPCRKRLPMPAVATRPGSDRSGRAGPGAKLQRMPLPSLAGEAGGTKQTKHGLDRLRPSAFQPPNKVSGTRPLGQVASGEGETWLLPSLTLPHS